MPQNLRKYARALAVRAKREGTNMYWYHGWVSPTGRWQAQSLQRNDTRIHLGVMEWLLERNRHDSHEYYRSTLAHMRLYRLQWLRAPLP